MAEAKGKVLDASVGGFDLEDEECLQDLQGQAKGTTKLDLSLCELPDTDEAVAAIGALVLACGASLHTLVLDDNALAGSSVAIVAAALKAASLSGLQFISLKSNGIDDEGVEALTSLVSSSLYSKDRAHKVKLDLNSNPGSIRYVRKCTSKAEFIDTLENNKTVVVAFISRGLADVSFAPVFARLAQENLNLLFMEVDIDTNEAMFLMCGPKGLNVVKVPTFTLFHCGRKIQRVAGSEAKKIAQMKAMIQNANGASQEELGQMARAADAADDALLEAAIQRGADVKHKD